MAFSNDYFTKIVSLHFFLRGSHNPLRIIDFGNIVIRNTNTGTL